MMSNILHRLVDIHWEQNQVLNPNLQCRPTVGPHAYKYFPSSRAITYLNVHSFHAQLLHDMSLLPPDVIACLSLNTFRMAKM